MVEHAFVKGEHGGCTRAWRASSVQVKPPLYNTVVNRCTSADQREQKGKEKIHNINSEVTILNLVHLQTALIT